MGKVFVTGLIFLYYLSFCGYGLNLWDEGALLNGGLRTLWGESVLRDFNGYQPGRYILAAFLYKLFGISFFPVRVAISFFTAIAVMLLYCLTKSVVRIRFLAFVPALIFMIAPSVYYNRFFPILTILNLFLIISCIKEEDQKSKLALLAGIVLAACFKLEIAVISIIVSSTVFILLGKRRVFPFVFTVVAVTISSVFIFAGTSYFYYFFHLIFKIHDKWSNPFPALFNLDLWKDPFSNTFFETLLFYFPPAVYLFLGAYLTLFFKLIDKKKSLYILTILLFGFFTYGLIIWRSGFDNLIRVLPPALVGGAFIFEIVFLRVSGKKAAKAGFLVFMTLLTGWYFYFMIARHGFYVGSPGVINESKSLIKVRDMTIYSSATEVRWIEEIVSYIDKNSNENDPVFSVPLNTIWNFFTLRKNPTKYEWILPGTFSDENMESEVVKSLEKNPPEIVISSDIAIDGKEERRFSVYAARIYDWIRKDYVKVKEVGIFEIWQRKRENY